MSRNPKPTSPPPVMMCACGTGMALQDMHRRGHRIVCASCAETPRVRPSRSCQVEVFFDDFTRRFGWQCHTCDAEGDGFRTIGLAEQAGDDHRSVGGASTAELLDRIQPVPVELERNAEAS